MNISFNRIILFVQNVEQVKNFYQQHFYFEVSEETKDQWVVLKAGNGEIAFHKAGISFKENDLISVGSNNNVKLVFETDSDLHQLREALIQNNVAMKEVISFGNSPRLFCDGSDIEGNVFQIVQVIF